MSVVPIADLRPARTTRHYGLPVPGDAGPADYVADTGALADAVDTTLNEEFEPIHAFLTTGGMQPFPNPPKPGQLVLVHVTGSAFCAPTDDSASNPVWALRADTEAQPDGRWAWRFVGGAPLTITRLAPPAGVYTGNGRFLIIGPVVYSMFQIGVEAVMEIHFGAAMAAIGNATGYACFAPGIAHDAWAVGRNSGGIEVGTNDGIRSANVAAVFPRAMPPGPPADAGPRWLALHGGAPAGQAFSLSWGWVTLTPRWIMPLAPSAATRIIVPEEREPLPDPPPTTPFPDDWPEHLDDPAPPITDPPFITPDEVAPQ
jgi:hypothetical protein